MSIFDWIVGGIIIILLGWLAFGPYLWEKYLEWKKWLDHDDFGGCL